MVFLITGTRKGIGRSLAEHYIGKGRMVVGCSREDTSIPGDYKHYSLDVSDEGAVVKMVRQVYRDYGRIDILINNAGTAFMNHFIITPYDNVKQIFSTNFYGTFLFSREVSKMMIYRRLKGRIINISSVAVPFALEGESIYASSKSAVEEFTRITAKELSQYQYGITVNCVGIAPIETDIIKRVPKEKIANVVNKLTIKRKATPEDIIKVIDFFIDSDFVTGQTIYLGGV